MKVLHLSTADAQGGAAIAANRLCDALRAAGADAQVLTRWPSRQDSLSLSPTPADEDAIALGEALQAGYVDRRRSDLSDTLFSLETFQLPLGEVVERHRPDIIHLHWVARFVTSGDLIALAGLGRPIVWTLHDMWPFTGGCHYSAGCRGFTADCAACPQLIADPAGAVVVQLDARAKAAAAIRARLVCVCPSRWLAECARASTPLRKTAVEVIANGLDTVLFSPAEQAQARARLGLDAAARYIGFGASDLSERRKGFVELRAALERVAAERGTDRPPIGLVCFGRAAEDVRVAGVKVITLGKLASEANLADAYRAVDAFALTSLEDNLPNTAIEAAACGTPVVAYRTGGIPEVVTDGSTGLLVDVGDRGTLAAAIARLADDGPLRAKLGAAAREDASRRFSLPRLAADHLALYERLLGSKLRSPRKAVVALPGLAPGVVQIALPAVFVEASREMRRTAAELAAAIEWGRRAEKKTASERKRADDAEGWAKQVEATLEQQRTLEQSLRQWIAQSEAAANQARADASEFKRWAERTEALLLEARTEAMEAKAWATKADASREQERSNAAQHRQWAEDAEQRFNAARAEANQNRDWALRVEASLEEARLQVAEASAWAERTEGSLAEARRKAEASAQWARQADEQHERDQAQILALKQWAESAEQRLATAEAAALDNRSWAERTEAMLRAARAEAEQARNWARRADEERERGKTLLEELARWAESAEAKAAAAQRLADENRQWAERAEAHLAQARVELTSSAEVKQLADAECSRLRSVVAGLDAALSARLRELHDAEVQLSRARVQVAALEAEIEPLRRFAGRYRWVYLLHHGNRRR